ncbi:MAG: DUF4340 domain-containing protein [Candidatus Parcubacteria bacterium]|nr:DUF4340 domain-containing protein [Burkholderiales bacterium]
MSARLLGVMLVLLVALGGGALLMRQQAASQKPAGEGTLGQPVFKGLQASQVAAVAIRQPKETLTIAKKDERWTIAERGGFPADLDKVRDFVVKAMALKVGQSEPIGEKDRARLLLDAGGTAVELQGADGKPLAQLTVGVKYFKVAPENPEKANGDGRYVMVPGDAKRVIVVSDPLSQVSTRSADWISKAGFAAEKVKILDVRFPDASAWKIERSGDNADWKLIGARADEKLEITRANAASYSLSLIELADVARTDAKPEDTGLDKPTVITATTLDGLVYTLKVGKPAGDSYYATVAIAGEPKPEGKDAEERLKKINERLPREKALGAHTLLIPKSKLEDVLRNRADLLAKKEEKKK